MSPEKASDLSIGELRMLLNEGDKLVFEDDRLVIFRKKSAPAAGQANIPIEIASVGIGGLYKAGHEGIDRVDYVQILKAMLQHIKVLIKADGKPIGQNEKGEGTPPAGDKA